jgi:hypothetical protein
VWVLARRYKLRIEDSPCSFLAGSLFFVSYVVVSCVMSFTVVSYGVGSCGVGSCGAGVMLLRLMTAT